MWSLQRTIILEICLKYSRTLIQVCYSCSLFSGEILLEPIDVLFWTSLQHVHVFMIYDAPYVKEL